jgi:hypothetical protein
VQAVLLLQQDKAIQEVQDLMLLNTVPVVEVAPEQQAETQLQHQVAMEAQEHLLP